MKKLETDFDSRKLLDRGYVRRLAPDETGGYVASILEFPGCVAEGDTADEALQNLDKAAESWLDVALAHGQHIREPIDFDGCRGNIALRMPRTLHKQAIELADLEGCSLNQLLVTAIAHYIGGKQLALKLEELIQPLHVTSNLLVGNNFIFSASASSTTTQLQNVRISEQIISNRVLPAKLFCFEKGMAHG